MRTVSRICCAAIIAGMAGPVFAAPLPPSDVCIVEGVIETVGQREEPYTPESWRQSWGLPESRNYIDIELALERVSLHEEVDRDETCKFEALVEATFQLRSMDELHKLEAGKCVTGKTQYSGDEFAHGQWLWDIENCENQARPEAGRFKS